MFPKGMKARYTFTAGALVLLSIVWWAVGTDKSIPITGEINRSGTYVLQHDRNATEKFVIKINADDVILDLNGKTLRCDSFQPNEYNFGILGIERKNVSIKNGTIEGCVVGVQLSYSSYVRIEKVEFRKIAYMGISLGGRRNVIVNSDFSNFGGWSGEAYTVGINNPGENCIIEKNEFAEFYRQRNALLSKNGEGVGIIVTLNSKGCQILSNIMKNTNLLQPHSIGIWGLEGYDLSIIGNHLVNFARGVIINTGVVSSNTIELDMSQTAALSKVELKKEPARAIHVIGETKKHGNIIRNFEF